jgi:ribonuclease Z
MKLVLLGTTGYHPNDRRHTACFMVPELGLVLDAGTGMFRVREHLQTQTLDILLTHGHLDHVIGLTFLFDVLLRKNLERVAVHAAEDKIHAVDEHLFAELLFPVQPPFTWVPLADEILLNGDFRVRHFPLPHPGGSVGFRLDGPGRSLAYVTDTTARADADYIEQIRGVDLLIHECYFPDGQEEFAEITGHSCATPVAEVACAAKVGRLLLVHVNPASTADDPIGIDTVRKIFPRAEIGEDGMEIEV